MAATAQMAVSLRPSYCGSTRALRGVRRAQAVAIRAPRTVASGEKVAVWGGNGFVGSRVCKELVSRVSQTSKQKASS